MRSIGTLADIAASPQEPEPDSTQAQIDALAKRVATLESLLADVMLQLDNVYHGKPDTKKSKPQKQRPETKDSASPADKILMQMASGPQLRLEIIEKCGLSEDAGKKAWSYLFTTGQVEKTGEKKDGASLWQICENPIPISEKPEAKTKNTVSKTPSPFLEADIQAIIDFGQQHGDRLWRTTTLAKTIRDACGISRKRIANAFVVLKENGTLKIVENVEVDGELLKGAYQFAPKEEDTV